MSHFPFYFFRLSFMRRVGEFRSPLAVIDMIDLD
jgi:hypothetical protein